MLEFTAIDHWLLQLLEYHQIEIYLVDRYDYKFIQID